MSSLNELGIIPECDIARADELARQNAEIERLKAQRNALRAALELYRGQVDQTGRHSAAEAIERAAAEASLTAILDSPERGERD